VVQGAWESLGADAVGLVTTAANPITTGVQFEFIMDKGITAKKFIEEQILKIIGGFVKVTGDGALSASGYADLYQSQGNITSFSPELSIGVADCISWTALDYNYQKMANEILLEFDEHIPLSGKLKRATLFLDATARTKWGNTKPLSYKSFGLVPFVRDMTPIYNRVTAVLARLANPPLSMKITLPSRWHYLEVGDLLRVTLPIKDLSLNPTGDLDRVFEIISTSFNEVTGHVVIDIEAQPTAANIDTIQQTYFPQNAQRSVSAAYQIGTVLPSIATNTSIGTLGSQTTYYNVGNLTLPSGVTLTVNGSVIIYVDGTFTIDGSIDGIGKGVAGAAQGANSNPGGWAYGAAPSNTGYVGQGGTGATVGASHNQGWGAQHTAAARHAIAPIVTPVVQTTTQLAGIPTETLWGGGGGTGGNSLSSGGNGGAGLIIVCRGIIMVNTAEKIDLSGSGGANGTGGGGGGGGGSLLILVEDQVGVGVDFTVFSSKVVYAGGAGGGSSLLGYGYFAADPHAAYGGGGGSFTALRF